LLTQPICAPLASLLPKGILSLDGLRLSAITVVAALICFAPQIAQTQQIAEFSDSPAPLLAESLSPTYSSSAPAIPEPAAFAAGPSSKHVKKPVESEVTFYGMASYGDWQVFGNGPVCKLYTAGAEYDRHSWGHHLGADFDYVAEVLPVMVLNEPAKLNYWGVSYSKQREILYGGGFSPIGIRFQWFTKKKIKPYLSIKGGMLSFTKKALSPNATYENFTFQSSVGVQVKMNERWDLRLGLFNDFHFSDAFLVGTNPGLDVMNSNLGLTYHFKKPGM
jgi:hypothetical protein